MMEGPPVSFQDAPSDRTVPSASSLLLPPAFVQDPTAYLSKVASLPSSREGLAQLAGSVATWFQSSTSADTAPQFASIYLQAAASQLQYDDSATILAGTRIEETEMLLTQQKYEIIEAVGAAASHCLSSRMSITSSGILTTLGQMMLNQPNELQQASTEFLQCAILAEQYRYASRLIQDTWPRPSESSSVKQVLRYYYLRGMVHLGCNDFTMAHRCFWTCLSIPAENVSKIMLEAWKKLLLVQCLLYHPKTDSVRAAFQSPKSMPSCMTRLLSSYKETSKLQSPTPQQQQQQQQPEQTQQQELEAEELLQQTNPERFMQRRQQKLATETVVRYMEFAESFYKSEKETFQNLMESHQAAILEDGNLGLLQQCLSQLVRNQVIQLSRMYSVVPISKVASLLKITDESLVPTVLLESKVPCQIQGDGMVVFQDDDSTDSSQALVDMAEWMHIIEKVQKLDVAVMTSPRYHALVQKEVSGKKEGISGGPRGVEDI